MDFFYSFAAEREKTRCELLQAPNYLNLALSVFILLGILVSYLPQHYRIISRASSEGISPYFILLGTTSGTCSFANILVQPATRADVACCKLVSTFECAAGLLGIVQMGIQWSCFTLILLLFLIYFKPPLEPTALTHSHIEPHKGRKQDDSSFIRAIIVAVVCLVHALVVLIISATLQISRPNSLGTWANILGVTGTVLAAIQYMPQIWMTWHLGRIGSLSIPMMLIQTPGSFVWSASLAARLGPEGWSTWGLFLVTGTLQGCLLGLGIYFQAKAKRENKGLDEDDLPADSGNSVDGNYHPNEPHLGHIIETDDEGNADVEDALTETTPLMKKSSHSNGSRKSSRVGTDH